jgi:ribonuclease R
VRPGTPLDREALQRGTSVYLPDRVIPMLPEIISNGLASLQPDRVRYTKTAMIELTADGARVACDLHSAAIKSCRRFTYEEIDEYLADPEGWKSKLAPEVHALVGRMHELAMILRERRVRRGALELTMQEVKIDLDKDGRVAGAHRVVNTVSHQIIEEFMLSANEAVAERLKDVEVAFLRRVHHAPSPMKVRALNDFVTALGFETEGLESRFELQKLLADVAGQPEQYAVNYAVLRSLQRAEYSPEEEGHYALSSEHYCHFTSPIRRYPDLTIHRLVNVLATGKTPKSDFTELVVLGQQCSDRERRAEAAERELVKMKLLAYMSSRVGEEMDAVITGVEAFGMFAQGIEIPAEGLIHVSSLADDLYQYEKATHSLAGRRSGNHYRLGDRVRVTVANVDVDRRELDFRLVKDLGRPKHAKIERPRHKTKQHSKERRKKR